MAGAALVLLQFAAARLLAQTSIQTDATVEARDFVGDGSQLTNLASGVYRNTVLVSRTGSNRDSGDALLAALGSIALSAHESNRFLLKLEPGIYDLGDASLVMVPYIDIEGSGQGVTIIKSDAANTSTTNPIGTLMGATNSELRFLTVSNWSPDRSIAIVNRNTSGSFLHVTAHAGGDGSYNYGIFNYNASPALTGVRAIADNVFGHYNTGLYNSSSAPVLRDVFAIGRDGVLTNSGMRNTGAARTLTIEHSVFEGSCGESSCESGSTDRSIVNDPDFTLHILASRLLGNPDTNGTYKCIASAIDLGTTLIAANSACRSGI